MCTCVVCILFVDHTLLVSTISLQPWSKHPGCLKKRKDWYPSILVNLICCQPLPNITKWSKIHIHAYICTPRRPKLESKMTYKPTFSKQTYSRPYPSRILFKKYLKNPPPLIMEHSMLPEKTSFSLQYQDDGWLHKAKLKQFQEDHSYAGNSIFMSP
jgi:hypothetical protein